MNDKEICILEKKRESASAALSDSIRLVTNLIILVSTGGIIAIITKLDMRDKNTYLISGLLFFLISIFMLFVATIHNYLDVRKIKFDLDSEFEKSIGISRPIDDRQSGKKTCNFWKDHFAWVICLVSMFIGASLAIVGLFTKG